MRKIKVAILDMYNGHPNEGMRCIKMLAGQFLAQEGIEGQYDVFDVRQECQVPDMSYDILAQAIHCPQVRHGKSRFSCYSTRFGSTIGSRTIPKKSTFS
jgi:hypothetical protein